MVKRVSGFTLTQLLVVIGILAILAAILFPVLSQAKGAALSKSCLANMGQLSKAMALYGVDADDRTPSPSTYAIGTRVAFDTGMGWAGKIFPYVKTAASFQCPQDTVEIDPKYAPPGSVKVSYAANDNILNQQVPQLAGSRTVLLFEVSRDRALLTYTDEGQVPRPSGYSKTSASGNGIEGSILDSFKPYPGINADGVDVMYATGRLSNSDDTVFWDDFDGDGRHAGGANYAAVDTHVVWAKPGDVSAGSSAHKPGDSQTSFGCFIPPATQGNNLPCAEGVDHAGHKLTFSVN